MAAPRGVGARPAARLRLALGVALLRGAPAWRWDTAGPSGAADPGMRYAHTLTGWQSTTTQAILCGGYAPDTGALASGCVLLDPTAGWRFKTLVDPADAAGRAEHSAAFFGDYLLLYGGNTTQEAPHLPEVFKLGVWTPVPGVAFEGAPPAPRRGHTSALVAVPRPPPEAGSMVLWVTFGGANANASSPDQGAPLNDVWALDMGDGVSAAFTWVAPAVSSPGGAGLPAPRTLHSMALRPPPTVKAAPAPARTAVGGRRLRTGGAEAAAAAPTRGVSTGTLVVHGGIDAGGSVLSDVWTLSVGFNGDGALGAAWARVETSGAVPSFGHRAAVVGGVWYVVLGGQSTLDGSGPQPPLLRALLLTEARWMAPAAVGSAPSAARPLVAPALWIVGTTDEQDGFDDGTPGYEQSVLVHGGAAGGAAALGAAGASSASSSTLFLLSEVGIEELSPEAELGLLIGGGLAAAACLLGFAWCAFKHRRRSVASLARGGVATGLQRYYPSALSIPLPVGGAGSVGGGGGYAPLDKTGGGGGTVFTAPSSSQSFVFRAEPSRTVGGAAGTPSGGKRGAGGPASAGGGGRKPSGSSKKKGRTAAGGGSSSSSSSRRARDTASGTSSSGPASDSDGASVRRPSRAELAAAFASAADGGGDDGDGGALR